MSAKDEQRAQRVHAKIWGTYRNLALQSCLIPECQSSGKVIKAHSIQEKRVLRSVSNNGHVYMIKSTAQGFAFQLVGVRKATRFTGFCSQHDNELFDKVDLGDERSINPNDPEQAVRLSLRSTACEYWKKLNAQIFFRKLLQLARSGDVPSISEYINLDQVDVSKSLDYVISVAKSRLDGFDFAVKRIGRQFMSLLHQLESGKFHLSKFSTIRLKTSPTVVVSAHFPPEYNLSGKCIVSKMTGVDLPEVTLNIVPNENEVVLMFLWHKRYEQLFRSFFHDLENLKEAKRALILSQMLIMQVENMALSPRLVDMWEDQEKSAVLDLFKRTTNVSIPYLTDWNVDLFGIKSF